ncbi:MAG: hypothetical protein PVS2B2_16020 [Candidatus Acidiferrum sp.]
MRFPLTLSIPVAQFLVQKKVRLEKNSPLLLSLDPLGKRPSPENPKRKTLSVEECLAAVDENGSPMVSICGGEPLEYPEIGRLVKQILDRGRNVFLCTDGTLIRRKLHTIQPHSRFFWNISLQGTEAVHDRRAGRTGTFREAIAGIKSAKNAGFFVYVNTRIHPDSDLQDLAALFALLHEIHVDGYLLSPDAADHLTTGNESAIRRAMRERVHQVAVLLNGYNLIVPPFYYDFMSSEQISVGTERGSVASGSRQLLKWLFERSMGEKKCESPAPALAGTGRDMKKGAMFAAAEIGGPMHTDPEDEPEMVSEGGQAR